MTVGDLPRAVAFYRDVLGMRFLFEAPPAMAFFDCGGVRLMMSRPEQAGTDPGREYASIIYYAVDDIQQAARALEARGVLFEQPPHIVARLPHADLWMALLRDPDRHLLAIMSEVAKNVSGQVSVLALAPGRRGDVAVAGADAVVRAGDPDAQAVELAVGAARRRVAEHVLALQLLGDPRRRLVQLC